MRPRRTLLLGSTSAGVFFVALAVWAAPIGAFGVSSSPCSLISQARIKHDLGLAHVKETPVVGKHSPSDGGVVTSTCKNIIAWSGSAPTSPPQFATKVADGTGALIAIRTFVPDPSATSTSAWVTSGFHAKLSALLTACHISTHLRHGHYVSFPSDGAQNSAGKADALGHGLFAVCGVWDRSDTHRIIVIAGEVSRRSPAVREFKKIASAAVPRFW